MLPTAEQVITCPNCSKHYNWGGDEISLKDSTLWTDGHMEGPYLRPIDRAGKCSSCGGFMIAEDCVDRKLMKDTSKIEYEQFIQVLTLEDLLSIIDSTPLLFKLAKYTRISRYQVHVLGQEDIIMRHYFQINALMKINDLRRKKQKVEERLVALYNQFAAEVIERLDADHADHADPPILQAELSRNLGKFRSARWYLKKVNEPELKQIKRKIWWASLFRVRKLLVVYKNYPYNT